MARERDAIDKVTRIIPQIFPLVMKLIEPTMGALTIGKNTPTNNRMDPIIAKETL